MAYTIDKTNPIPRYLQIRQIIEDQIRSGKYGPGSRLPGERDLAAIFGVSQMTVNKAILSMVRDGWLRREVGNGTFVMDDLEVPRPETVTVGFAVPFSTTFAEDDIYLGSLMRGIQNALLNQPASFKALETPPERLYDCVMEAGLDGWILTDVLQTSLDDIVRLRQDGQKIVILGADEDPIHVPYVDSDNITGTREAVEHLLSLGHRRVAGAFMYLGKCNSRQRLASFRDTLRRNGVPVEEDFIIDLGDGEPLAGEKRERIASIFVRPDRPTALLCGGFYAALDMMQIARDAGLEIPTDLSVVGFDDPLAARYLSPPLTTVRQPLEEMGQCAMTYLCEWLLQGKEPPQRTVLPDTFVVRESTAPAKGSNFF